MAADLNSFRSQGEDVSVLLDQLADRQLVHACLLSGEKGLGKKTLASLMAASLLCESEGRMRPCGACRACAMSANLEHPDMIVIRQGAPLSPDVKKDRATIPVDDIREMIRLCSLRTMGGNARVVLIFDAEKMTPQAQNSLLKTLEEPPENTFILICTDHPDSLLTTVISRCRHIRLRPWPNEYVEKVLRDQHVASERIRDSVRYASGSIGKALELAGDETYWQMRREVLSAFFAGKLRSGILQTSNAWKDRKADAPRMLEILESMVRELLQVRLGGDADTEVPLFPDNWAHFARSAPVERFLFLLDAVSQARKQLQFNVNFQAVLEQLLFAFMGEGSQW